MFRHVPRDTRAHVMELVVLLSALLEPAAARERSAGHFFGGQARSPPL